MGNQSLRFEDIVGQEDVIARLKRFSDFFGSTGGTPGHILLIGEDGTGKSTIAKTLANNLNVEFGKVNAADIEIVGDFTALISNIKNRQVLLLSDLQQLRKIHVRRLREVLRNGTLKIVIGNGSSTRDFVLDIQPFTLVATCPRKSDCPAELLSEFSLVMSLQPYSRPQLETLVDAIAKKYGLSLENTATATMARCCDGSPGNLELMLRRVARSINKTVISDHDLSQVFEVFGVRARTDGSPSSAGNIMDLSGLEFENLITTLLHRMGFHAEMTKTSGDGGIDIVATLDKAIVGGRYLFQCKRFTPGNLIGAPTVRDFYGAVTADRAVKGIFITTSDFSSQAREFAERAGIELIDLCQLRKLLDEYGIMEVPEA